MLGSIRRVWDWPHDCGRAATHIIVLHVEGDVLLGELLERVVISPVEAEYVTEPQIE